MVDDQRGGPTPAGAIADALLAIAAAFGRGAGVGGVFHFAGAPAVSWAEFARAIFAAKGRQGAGGAADPDQRLPDPGAAAAELGARLRRRSPRAYGIAQPDWRAGLAEVIGELA